MEFQDLSKVNSEFWAKFGLFCPDFAQTDPPGMTY